MEFAQQLKQAVDIVAVISEKVRLNKVGRRFRGLCPFHQEKTPSFYVNPDLQFYKCFGCDAKGDVINFVMQITGCTFWEACKELAERFGIPLPKRTEFVDAEAKTRESIYRANEIALQYFRQQLEGPQGAEARAYLKGRGVNADTAAEFGIGLADRTGSALTQRLTREGFGAEQLEGSGLVLKRESGGFFDRFRGRLIFPIHDDRGKVVGFAGRALEKGDEPKYLNSPETALYKKQQLLYNLHRAKEVARKEGRVILVEGYMDVIGLWAGGVREVVASCGTALTAQQVKLMRRHADQIVVNFDPDAAGSAAAERSITIMLEEHVHIRMLELDRELDPDEYIREVGAEGYRSLLAKAPSYYLWMADRARRRYDTRTAEGRTEAMKFLLPLVWRIPDKIERAGIADDIASFLGVERGLLLEQFKKAAVDRREKTIKVQAAAPLPVADVMLLKAVVLAADLREELIPAFEQLGLGARPRLGRIFQTVSALFQLDARFGYGDLDARLEENDRALLHEVFFADEQHEADSIEAVRANALNCLRRLEADQASARMAQLRQRVKEAQRQGDLKLAIELMGEIDRMGRAGA